MDRNVSKAYRGNLFCIYITAFIYLSCAVNTEEKSMPDAGLECTILTGTAYQANGRKSNKSQLQHFSPS